jgi:hypothetical protein
MAMAVQAKGFQERLAMEIWSALLSLDWFLEGTTLVILGLIPYCREVQFPIKFE